VEDWQYGGLEFGKLLKTTITAKFFFLSVFFMKFCLNVEYFNYV